MLEMNAMTNMLIKAVLAVSFLAASASSASTTKYRAGQGHFTNKAIKDLAGLVGGEFGGHLTWFADNAELFTFPGHDGLPLQGYYIPVARNTQRDPALIPLPSIVHCAGWSETTIKYSKFLHILHEQGYPIYSFDLRGQGFSSETGPPRKMIFMDIIILRQPMLSTVQLRWAITMMTFT